MDDVGAPVAVTAVDLLSQNMFPKYNEWIKYGMAVVGYGAAYMNRGGDFAKNVGIASFPLAAEALYARVKGMGGTTKLAMRMAGSGGGVSRTYQQGFKDVIAF
jgi:hypothetical protein